ncbi:MAG: acetyl-CoA carboxylase biotin carboxyl carrier protein [Planctomycetes bacterium]|nr:acetyl-CoA carboxylase biotin carboxyl carrier protein [Planctomycetota bacterium]
MPAKPKKPNKKSTAAGSGSSGRGGAAAGDKVAQLQRLIEVMVEKDVVEVELEEAGTRWRVRRREPQAVAYATAAPLHAAPAMPLVAAPATAPAAPSAADRAPQGEVYKSPMLGTFYRAASPDAEPFVKPGDRVSADSTLCIIEAMKVMNEIKAEHEFVIVEVLVKNGDPVEFGQPLFLIR